MQKPSPAQAASVSSRGFADESWLKKYPTIVEYLTTSKWDDGTARELSSIAVTCSDGSVQIALNDKDLKQSLYTTAGSFTEAMGLMEKALQAGVEGWRPWKSGKRK